MMIKQNKTRGLQLRHCKTSVGGLDMKLGQT